jgi:hypothetical protein
MPREMTLGVCSADIHSGGFDAPARTAGEPASESHRQSQRLTPTGVRPGGLNVAAFSGVGQYVIGNSSRNPIRGPGLQNADVMLGKTFRLSERVNFEFRAEIFNVSNTPPLNDPNGIFGSAAFGTITSAGNPRDFEFAGKLRF